MISKIIKKFAPQYIQRLLHDYIYKRLGLRYRLDSGVRVSVESKTDFVVYSDIFVEGEYDDAIKILSDDLKFGGIVLDLGCNTGFFTLRCLDVLGRDQFHKKFKWISIDACGKTLQIYKKRVLVDNVLLGCVETIQGLVGDLDGSGEFYESTNHGNNTRMISNLESERKYTKNRINYINLNTLIGDCPITLIKCDIEGSEGDFVKNYQQLIQRAEAVVFELHHDCGETDYVTSKMIELGFTHRKIKVRSGTSMDLFNRVT